jgi:hypothetical protein
MRFEDYVARPAFLHALPTLPKKIAQFENLILYGPAGVGKYTLMLRIVRTYSHHKLKYEKRIAIQSNGQNYMLKISDIHYEVDMELLGCNAKLLWFDIYTHIKEIIECKYPSKHGIVVLKNFHKTHNELLEIFYSYMQDNIKYILLTEAVSFIPMAVAARCKLLPVPRPPAATYLDCTGVAFPAGCTNLADALTNTASPAYVAKISSKISALILAGKYCIAEMRDLLYSILIYSIDIEACMWDILRQVLPRIARAKHAGVLAKLTECVQCLNNHYRPIFHLEHFANVLAVAVVD